MTFRRIASPINHEIGSLLDFAERTSDLATQLGGYFGGTVSQRRVTVDQATQAVGERHTLFLCFTGGIAHAVNERHVGGVQVRCRRFDRLVERRFTTVDQGHGIFLFGGVIQEPRGSQDTSMIRFVNAHFVVVQLDVVADAATKRTGGIFDDL